MPISEDEPPSRSTPTATPSSRSTACSPTSAARTGSAAISLRYFNVAGAERAAGRGPRARDAPDPAGPARRRRPRTTHVSIFGTDYPTPDGTAMRDYIHVEDLATRAHARARAAPSPGGTSLQPRHRHRLLRARGDRGRRAVTGREIAVREEGRAAPATRHGSWPPGQGARGASAGSRERSLEDMVADAWAWHEANPDGYGGSRPIRTPPPSWARRSRRRRRTPICSPAGRVGQARGGARLRGRAAGAGARDPDDARARAAHGAHPDLTWVAPSGAPRCCGATSTRPSWSLPRTRRSRRATACSCSSARTR